MSLPRLSCGSSGSCPNAQKTRVGGPGVRSDFVFIHGVEGGFRHAATRLRLVASGHESGRLREFAMADAFVTTIGETHAGQLEKIAREIEHRMARSPETPLADKLEDALATVNAAGDKLRQARPDRQSALGELEGAVGDLDAAASAGLQPRGAGFDLMNRIAGAARELADDAIDEAVARRWNSTEIAEARAAFARGDARRRARGFKDALAA